VPGTRLQAVDVLEFGLENTGVFGPETTVHKPFCGGAIPGNEPASVAQFPLHEIVCVGPALTVPAGITTFTILVSEVVHAPFEMVHVNVYVFEPAGGVKMALAVFAFGENVPAEGDTVHVPVKGALTALADNVTGELVQLATSSPACAVGGSGNTVTETRFVANRLSTHLLENWNT